MMNLLRRALGRAASIMSDMLAGAGRSALLLTEAAARERITLAGYGADVDSYAEAHRRDHLERSASQAALSCSAAMVSTATVRPPKAQAPLLERPGQAGPGAVHRFR